MLRIIPAFMAVSVLRCVRLEGNVLSSAALSPLKQIKKPSVWRLTLLNWASDKFTTDVL